MQMKSLAVVLLLSLASAANATPADAVFVKADSVDNLLLQPTSGAAAGPSDGADLCEWDLVTAYCTTGEHPPTDQILHGVGVSGLGLVVGDFQSIVRGLESGRAGVFTCSVYAVVDVFDVVCNGIVINGGLPINEPYVHECYAAPYGTMDPNRAAEAGTPGFVATPLGIFCVNL